MSKRKTPLKKRINISAIEANLRKLGEESKRGQLRNYTKKKKKEELYGSRKKGSFLSR